MPGLIFWKINTYLEARAVTLVLCFGEAIPALGPIHRFCTMQFQSNSGVRFRPFFFSFIYLKFFFLRLLQKDENYDLGKLFGRGDLGSRELFVVNQTF